MRYGAPLVTCMAAHQKPLLISSNAQMSFEEEDQLILDAFADMDEKIKQLKAVVAFAELCMRKYRDAWALVQQTRSKCQP